MKKIHLRNRIREYVDSVRDQKKWSYSRIAKEADLSTTTITRFMNNPDSNVLSTQTLNAIQEATGIPMPANLNTQDDNAHPAPNDGNPLPADDTEAALILVEYALERSSADLSAQKKIQFVREMRDLIASYAVANK